MLNVGDAVLTFLGDTSDLDQVFARIPEQADASMAAASASVDQLGASLGQVNFELDATGSNVPYAGETIKSAMTQAVTPVKTLGQTLVEAGQAGNSLADAFRLIQAPVQQSDVALQNMAFSLRNVSGSGMPELENHSREAAAEVGLLGEAFGITLPRHVRTFVGEIPGISTALSAAFSATAVYFLIEAFVKVVEKIQEIQGREHELALAFTDFNTAAQNSFNGLDEKFLQTGLSIDRLRGDHVAALKKELELINQASMRDLVAEFDVLSKSADAVMEHLKSDWLLLDLGATGAKDALVEFKSKYDSLLANKDSKGASDLLAGTLKSAQDTLAVMKDQTLQMSKTDAAIQIATGNATLAALAIAQAAGNGEREVKAQELLVQTLKDQIVAQGKINDLKKEQTDDKVLADVKREEAAQEALAKKQEALYFEIAKAHDALQKEIEKGVDATSKIEAARLTAQLKDEENSNVQELKLIHEKEVAAIAAIDGEMKHTQEVNQTKALGYKQLLDLGIMSGEQYLAKMSALYSKEAQDLKDALTRKQQLVILEAQNEAAQRGKILTDAEAKELKSYIDLETQKQNLTDRFTVQFAKDQDQVLKASDKVFRTKSNWDTFFKDLQTQALTTGQKFQLLGNEITASIGESVQAAVSGSDSFGAAMEKILKSALASLAGEAAVHVIKEIALAASDLATVGMEWHAGLHFKAAAEWAAVGAVAGVGGAAMPGGSGSGGGSGSASTSSSASTASTASGQPAQQPTAVANVPKLFSGAIVTRPTLAMIGDRQGGGSQTEGVFPLDDPRGRKALMDAFGMSGGGSGGDINHNYFINGMVSTSDLTKLTRVISRSANTGRVRVSVSNASRVTRKS